MITVNIEDVAPKAKDVKRSEWVASAALKIVDGEVEYKEPSGSLICLANEMSHLMSFSTTETLLAKWIQGAECCDVRDELRERLIFIVECQLQSCADKYDIGSV